MQTDRENDWAFEKKVTLQMDRRTAAYLVGDGRANLRRLERASLARIFVGTDLVTIQGTLAQIDLARLCIDVMLSFRRESTAKLPFEDIERRKDVSMLDVPVETGGFLVGKKGQSQRTQEEKFGVLMFFDNDRIRQCKYGPCKRLYVIGTRNNREGVLDEAEDVVRCGAAC